ncbi:dTDP-4-dehydro-6-deoxyglucose reductase [compost metagenome]
MTIAKDLHELEKVVFASSYLIYNPDLYNFAEPARTPYLLSEDAPIYPRNLCGAAKLLHEIELRFISEMKQLQCKTISARIYRVYGKNSKDIISRWIRALLNNEEIQVFRKEGMFDYIYADEVAEGLVRLVSSEAEGIVNLGNGNARRVEDVIAILRKHFPNMRAVEAESSILYEASEADMSKFKSITGWAPTRQLEDTIPELIEYYSTHINNHGSCQSKSILITSSSKKVPLINSVRKAIAKLGQPVQVIAGDSNPNAISRYFADQFWEMPQLSTMSQAQFLQYCKNNNVEYVIPTRDGELEYFSEMKSLLQDNGVSVLVSDREALTVCLDKLAFYQQTTSMSVPVIPATEDI